MMPPSVRAAMEARHRTASTSRRSSGTTRFVFDRFLRLAASHGIPVYWVVMPM